MISADLHHPAVSAALEAAAGLVGMEVAFVGSLTDEEFSFVRVHGELPGLTEGMVLPRADSFCHQLLAGAPSSTADAATDPAYADVPARAAFGITSYVGVPVHRHDGTVIGTLCGVDRGSVKVPAEVVQVLTALAGVIEAHVEADAAVVLRRTSQGWRVGNHYDDDLMTAMVLADLLSDGAAPAARPARPGENDSEVERLQVAVSQLEHALAARVVVEQAIGILSERQHLPARLAFERLRKAARSRGRKVHDLARMVVASVNDPAVPLPPELAGRR